MASHDRQLGRFVGLTVASVSGVLKISLREGKHKVDSETAVSNCILSLESGVSRLQIETIRSADLG